MVRPGDMVGCMECVGVLLQGGRGIVHAVMQAQRVGSTVGNSLTCAFLLHLPAHPCPAHAHPLRIVIRQAGGRKSQSERGNVPPSSTRLTKGDRAPFAIVAPSACMTRHSSPHAVHCPLAVCSIGVVSDKLVCRCCRRWWCPWASRTFYFVEG